MKMDPPNRGLFASFIKWHVLVTEGQISIIGEICILCRHSPSFFELSLEGYGGFMHELVDA